MSLLDEEWDDLSDYPSVGEVRFKGNCKWEYTDEGLWVELDHE